MDTQQGQTAPQEVILYRNMTLRLFAGISFSIVALFALLYYVLHYFTDSPIPAGDAFTTAVGIVATWMLARRIVEHWIFWIVVNCVSVYLYYLRGLYPSSSLVTEPSRRWIKQASLRQRLSETSTVSHPVFVNSMPTASIS